MHLPDVAPLRGHRPRVLVAASIAVLACGLTACSSSSATSPTTSSSASPSASGDSFDGVTVSGALGDRPVVLIGDSTQETSSLQVHDVVVGKGPAATASDKVTVQYVARSAKTKRTFDSSWDRGTPFSYDPAKIAFKAFTEGVPGMKVGGRRIVVVPAALAFGASPPASTGLGANETLVFVIDLVSIDNPD